MDKSDTTCVTKESGTLVPIRTILPPSVRVAANPNADRSSTWTQARTPQRYAENLVDLAAFQVWLRQDNPFEDLPVQIELTCGTATLPIGDQMLQVGTIRVLLRLAFVEASIKPGTQYEMEALGYQARSEQSDTGSSTRGLQGEIGLAPPSLSPVGLCGKFLASFGRKGETSQSTSETSQRDEKLLGPEGKDSFAFGIADRGDPRHKYGLLRGIYPPRLDRDADMPPLFSILPGDFPGAPTPNQMEMTVLATVPLDSLMVLIKRKPRPATGEERAKAEQHGEADVEPHLDDVEELRRQMAQQELGERAAAAQRRHGLPVRPGECLLGVQTIVITRHGSEPKDG